MIQEVQHTHKLAWIWIHLPILSFCFVSSYFHWQCSHLHQLLKVMLLIVLQMDWMDFEEEEWAEEGQSQSSDLNTSVLEKTRKQVILVEKGQRQREWRVSSGRSERSQRKAGQMNEDKKTRVVPLELLMRKSSLQKRRLVHVEACGRNMLLFSFSCFLVCCFLKVCFEKAMNLLKLKMKNLDWKMKLKKKMKKTLMIQNSNFWMSCVFLLKTNEASAIASVWDLQQTAQIEEKKNKRRRRKKTQAKMKMKMKKRKE